MANEYTKAVLYGIQNFNDKVKEKAKKEIGILKLIELLNEYEGQDTRYYDKDIGFCYGWGDGSNYELEIISKKFGFIKWLVDNDKIDYTQLAGYSLWETVKNDGWTNYICLIMVLAVSDNPIEFLISILKDKKVRTVYVDEDGNVSGDTKQYSNC